MTGSTIINDIADTIKEYSILPVFAAEGTARQKLVRIRSFPYLNHCYNTISRLSETLFIFGHSASENDPHIYDAICKSNLDKVFICAHNPAQNLQQMVEAIAKYTARAADIDWAYVDASTVSVWSA
jgi:hypothetical protein